MPDPAAERSRRFTVKSIASLSPGSIAALANAELIEVIRAVDYPYAGKERLEFFDRDTLQRVVHLVCRWCKLKLTESTMVEKEATDSQRLVRAGDWSH